MPLAGLGGKQIAQNFRLSVHMVNDHLKASHRNFNVISRGEVQSRFVRGGNKPERQIPCPRFLGDCNSLFSG
jgi:hypothetical protein